MLRMNNQLNLGLHENNETTNRDCPVIKNNLNAKKKRMRLII